MAVEITGYVARILNQRELILNVGKSSGVEVGDKFAVLDPEAIDVPDPKTRENLGSLERIRAIVQVDQVAENISVAKKIWPREEDSRTLAEIIAGSSPSSRVRVGREWPEGVAVGDPVRIRR